MEIYRHQLQHGLTLLELLTTLAIIFTLIGIGTPLLNHITATNRMASMVNSLAGSLAYARSEAVHRGESVVICTRSGNHCDNSNDWSQGWLVFGDKNGNRRRDADEPMLVRQDANNRFIQAGYRAFGSNRYIAFKPSGVPDVNGTFTFCNPDNPADARALIMNKPGRVYKSRTGYGGKPLKCGR